MEELMSDHVPGPATPMEAAATAHAAALVVTYLLEQEFRRDPAAHRQFHALERFAQDLAKHRIEAGEGVSSIAFNRALNRAFLDIVNRAWDRYLPDAPPWNPPPPTRR
jgi:hypothetical protein